MHLGDTGGLLGDAEVGRGDRSVVDRVDALVTRQFADLLGVEGGRDRRCRREPDGPFVEAQYVGEHRIDQRGDDLAAPGVEFGVDAVDLARLERLAGCLGPFGQLRRAPARAAR